MRSEALRQKDKRCRTQNFRYRREGIAKRRRDNVEAFSNVSKNLSSSCLLAYRHLWTSEDQEIGMPEHPDRLTRLTDEPQQKQGQFRSSSEAPTNVACPMIQRMSQSTTTSLSVLQLQQSQNLDFMHWILSTINPVPDQLCAAFASMTSNGLSWTSSSVLPVFLLPLQPSSHAEVSGALWPEDERHRK